MVFFAFRMTVKNGSSTMTGGDLTTLSRSLMVDPRVTHGRWWNKMRKKMKS